MIKSITSFCTLIERIVNQEDTKDARMKVCGKIDEFLSGGYTIISVSETFVQTETQGTTYNAMRTTIYYKQNENKDE